MQRLFRRAPRGTLAILAAVAAPLLLTLILVPFRTSFPNTDAALVLILVVVAVAGLGHRLAGVLGALSAAAWFDFFLTRPYERFTITRSADIETTVLILVIGAAVTEIAVWGRRQHLAASRRAGYLEGINAAAEAVAVGGSPLALIDQVCAQLTRLLALRSCRFEYGVAGLGRPARLLHDGRLVSGGQAWDVERQGLPGDTVSGGGAGAGAGAVGDSISFLLSSAAYYWHGLNLAAGAPSRPLTQPCQRPDIAGVRRWRDGAGPGLGPVCRRALIGQAHP